MAYCSSCWHSFICTNERVGTHLPGKHMEIDGSADLLRNSTLLDCQHSRYLAKVVSFSCYPLAPADRTHYSEPEQLASSHVDAFLVPAACKVLSPTNESLKISGASDHRPTPLTMPNAAQVLRPPAELPKPKYVPCLCRVQTQTAVLDFQDQLQPPLLYRKGWSSRDCTTAPCRTLWTVWVQSFSDWCCTRPCHWHQCSSRRQRRLHIKATPLESLSSSVSPAGRNDQLAAQM